MVVSPAQTSTEYDNCAAGNQTLLNLTIASRLKASLDEQALWRMEYA